MEGACADADSLRLIVLTPNAVQRQCRVDGHCLGRGALDALLLTQDAPAPVCDTYLHHPLLRDTSHFGDLLPPSARRPEADECRSVLPHRSRELVVALKGHNQGEAGGLCGLLRCDHRGHALSVVDSLSRND